MNEWDRLRRQAERYKQDFPAGTRILLLRMGSDPDPVEDNTRGTVIHVDDIGTVHCKFDNGRQLGIVPGEDSLLSFSVEGDAVVIRREQVCRNCTDGKEEAFEDFFDRLSIEAQRRLVTRLVRRVLRNQGGVGYAGR